MKLVILDRDGVINFDSEQFIKSPDEWKPIPGSLEAIAALNQAGFRVVVASNQSGIGRGLFEMATLAIRWLVAAARARNENTLQERLAGELIDASNNPGNAVKKREDTHRMAEANRAFSHYRW